MQGRKPTGKALLLLAAAAGLSGCSKLKDFERLPASGFTSVTVGRSGGPNIATPQNGGILVYAVNQQNKNHRAARWLGPGTLTTRWDLPNGPYRFFALGYTESNLNSASNVHRCGLTEVIGLNGTPREISIDISTAGCDETSFLQVPGSFDATTKQARPLLLVSCAGGGGDTASNTTTGATNVCDGGSWFNNDVKKLALDSSSGKIYVLGQYTTYNGASVGYVVRLNRDGTLDTTFNTGTGFDVLPTSIALDPSSSKLFVIGTFTSYDGTSVAKIARLNTNGTLDTAFDPSTSFNSAPTAIAVQSDGKPIVGGTFTTYRGASSSRLVRINTDGSLDTSFNVGTGGNANVLALALQSDGDVVIGGLFTTFNSATAPRLARINSDGTLDTGFNVGTGPSSAPSLVAVDSSNNVWATGAFTTYNGVGVGNLIRIFPDGTRDTNSNIASTNSNPNAIVPLSDGKVLLGGQFTTYNAATVNFGVMRLDTNFTADTTFNNGGTGTASATGAKDLAVDSNGMIVMGGNFTQYNGQTFNRIIRLNSMGSNDTHFGSGVPQASSHIATMRVSLLAYDHLTPQLRDVSAPITSGCFTNATQGAHKITDIRIPTGTTINPAFAIRLETFSAAGCTGTYQARYDFFGGQVGIGTGIGPNYLKTVTPSDSPASFSTSQFKQLFDGTYHWFFFREINN